MVSLSISDGGRGREDPGMISDKRWGIRVNE